MKYVAAFIGLLGLLVVSGCQEQVRQTVMATCNALDEVYAHYDAVNEAGAISANTKRKVALIRSQTDNLCASPSTINTVILTAVASRAYLVLSAALKEGGELSNARVGYVKVQNLKKFLEEFKQ